MLVGIGVLESVDPVELTVETLAGEVRMSEVGLTASDDSLETGQASMSSWAPVGMTLYVQQARSSRTSPSG